MQDEADFVHYVKQQTQSHYQEINSQQSLQQKNLNDLIHYIQSNQLKKPNLVRNTQSDLGSISVARPKYIPPIQKVESCVNRFSESMVSAPLKVEQKNAFQKKQMKTVQTKAEMIVSVVRPKYVGKKQLADYFSKRELLGERSEGQEERKTGQFDYELEKRRKILMSTRMEK